MIEVEKKNDREFLVIVDEKGFQTEHNVGLDDEYFQKLTKGKITKEELKKINVDVKINIAQMNEEERAKFTRMAQEGWR